MYGEVGEGLYRGCAMDSRRDTLKSAPPRTLPCTGPPLVHYRKMIELADPFLYMELRGIRYDRERAKAMLRRHRRADQACGRPAGRFCGQRTSRARKAASAPCG